MSHVVMGEGRIGQTDDDIKAIKMACEHLGLVFCEGQSEYKWYGRWMKDYHVADAAYRKIAADSFGKGAKHVIRLPWSMHDEEVYARDPSKRPYEIGLVEMEDGTLAPVFDNWRAGKGVATLVGKAGVSGARLVQTINQFKVVNQVAKNRGHRIKAIEPLPNGATKIVISGVRRPLV